MIVVQTPVKIATGRTKLSASRTIPPKLLIRVPVDSRKTFLVANTGGDQFRGRDPRIPCFSTFADEWQTRWTVESMGVWVW